MSKNCDYFDLQSVKTGIVPVVSNAWYQFVYSYCILYIKRLACTENSEINTEQYHINIMVQTNRK